MYTHTNFKSKKALKEAVAAGKEVTIFQPNEMFPNPKAAPDFTGKATIEGPHFPEPHKFYAEVEMVNGKIVKVK